MNVTQAEIIKRGLSNCCPNCGAKTLFSPEKPLTLNQHCANCKLKLEREEGFFLGAMAINYGVTCFIFLAPVAILWARHVLSDTVAAVIGLAGAFLVPLALYRSSRSWQLMLYYFFLPQHLPANGRARNAHEDENI